VFYFWLIDWYGANQLRNDSNFENVNVYFLVWPEITTVFSLGLISINTFSPGLNGNWLSLTMFEGMYSLAPPCFPTLTIFESASNIVGQVVFYQDPYKYSGKNIS